ncbi:helix-turn-helix domain-containing protein [Pseudomonas sp. GM48]|uniref:helix-turn-helix domain-containing protein n=1 Tax=Pseudomonas sp. GM48 TaxID=1144330 RepID=UPI0002704A4A|nr:LysR family transcriptional regulator [Pseudomonas sp. GM48]EJM55031.1 transcriptional regulator [Pseudomonas sp. GM48]
MIMLQFFLVLPHDARYENQGGDVIDCDFFRDLDLNSLIALVAVYEEGNVSRAACRLHLTQPAVSNKLAVLRCLLDDQLFVRSAKGVTPTTELTVMMAKIIPALELIEGVLKCSQTKV